MKPNFLTHCPCGAPRNATMIVCLPCWSTAPLDDRRQYRDSRPGKVRWEAALRLKEHARRRRQSELPMA